MKTLMMSTAAAIFAAGTAYAADVMVLIDTDGDGLVSVEEYRASADTWGDAGMDPMWSRWDADADGMLSADEYNQGIWTHYDSNDDGFIDGPELEAWDEDQLRYDATRSGREISPPG